ncbi:hypothetical protein SB776_41730, partial [Burkholderia sp. SIMBA_045]
MPPVAPATLPIVLPALRARLRVSIREDRQRGQRIDDPDDDGAALVGAGSGLLGSPINDSIASCRSW